MFKLRGKKMMGPNQVYFYYLWRNENYSHWLHNSRFWGNVSLLMASVLILISLSGWALWKLNGVLMQDLAGVQAKWWASEGFTSAPLGVVDLVPPPLETWTLYANDTQSNPQCPATDVTHRVPLSEPELFLFSAFSDLRQLWLVTFVCIFNSFRAV